MWNVGQEASGSVAPEPPALPVTWRPKLGRVLPRALSVPVVIASVLLALFLTPQYKLVDRVFFVLFGLCLAGLLHLVARPRVRASEAGLTVVNIVGRRELEWGEVFDANMAHGEPWPTLDLTDGTTCVAMGIQSNDGRHARRAVGELQALIHERGEAPEPS